MDKIIRELAKELIRRVRIITPKAKVVRNWEEDPDIVIDLVISYHKNIGKDFLVDPFGYINIKSFT